MTREKSELRGRLWALNSFIRVYENLSVCAFLLPIPIFVIAIWIGRKHFRIKNIRERMRWQIQQKFKTMKKFIKNLNFLITRKIFAPLFSSIGLAGSRWFWNRKWPLFAISGARGRFRPPFLNFQKFLKKITKILMIHH